MTNQQDNFSNGTSYVVRSSAFVRVDFGTVDLPSMPRSNAILVEFHGGQEYVYLAVPQTLYEALESAVVRHCENGERVGSLFSTRLFNAYPCYARLHSPNLDV